MRTETVDLKTPDGVMPVYQAVPDDPRAAVIVIQEAFGVNAHIEEVTRRFAGAGYYAVAPHLFYRAGGGTAPYDDFSKVLPLFEGLDDDGFLRDIDATVAHVKDAGFDPSQVGIVGFCMGGRVTFLAAARRALGGAVTFYGGGIVTARFPQFPPLIDDASNLQTPWLGLFGDEDASIPVEDVERLRNESAHPSVDTEVVRYAAAGHGFHCDARPDHFNAEAAADGWSRTVSWFAQHVG